MKIILTHEQADFDAVASQLGAYLLDETYIPMQPRKMNRNVRAFLTLYGMDLPFVSANDLPKGPVDAIKLVDTQSMVTVKGMVPATQVHVIDHHPLRDDLPPEWVLTVSGTGANTTLFVENSPRTRCRAEYGSKYPLIIRYLRRYWFTDLFKNNCQGFAGGRIFIGSGSQLANSV